MTMVSDMIETFKGLDLKKEALISISKTSGQYVELNQEQLSHGKRADGTKLPDYSPVSVKKFGKPAGPIMLYDTGDFYESFKLDVSSSNLQIVAADKYGLEKEYGKEIYGLGDTNQEYYNREIFLPEFAQKIEEQTGLKM